MLSGLGRHDQELVHCGRRREKAGVVLVTRIGRNLKLKILYEQAFWID